MNQDGLTKSNKGPARPGGGKPRNRSERRDRRREEALERAEKRAARTDQEQLALLTGAGHGGCQEAFELRRKVHRG